MSNKQRSFATVQLLLMLNQDRGKGSNEFLPLDAVALEVEHIEYLFGLISLEQHSIRARCLFRLWKACQPHLRPSCPGA